MDIKSDTTICPPSLPRLKPEERISYPLNSRRYADIPLYQFTWWSNRQVVRRCTNKHFIDNQQKSSYFAWVSALSHFLSLWSVYDWKQLFWEGNFFFYIRNLKTYFANWLSTSRPDSNAGSAYTSHLRVKSQIVIFSFTKRLVGCFHEKKETRWTPIQKSLIPLADTTSWSSSEAWKVLS